MTVADILGLIKLIQAIRRWRKRSKEGVIVNEQFSSVIRTIFKAVGGGLVTHGYVGANELDILAGAFAIVAGMAWSWYVKRKES